MNKLEELPGGIAAPTSALTKFASSGGGGLTINFDAMLLGERVAKFS